MPEPGLGEIPGGTPEQRDPFSQRARKQEGTPVSKEYKPDKPQGEGEELALAREEIEGLKPHEDKTPGVDDRRVQVTAEDPAVTMENLIRPLLEEADQEADPEQSAALIRQAADAVVWQHSEQYGSSNEVLEMPFVSLGDQNTASAREAIIETLGNRPSIENNNEWRRWGKLRDAMVYHQLVSPLSLEDTPQGSIFDSDEAVVDAYQPYLIKALQDSNAPLTPPEIANNMTAGYLGGWDPEEYGRIVTQAWSEMTEKLDGTMLVGGGSYNQVHGHQSWQVATGRMPEAADRPGAIVWMVPLRHAVLLAKLGLLDVKVEPPSPIGRELTLRPVGEIGNQLFHAAIRVRKP